jgi:hypothetical protein
MVNLLRLTIPIYMMQIFARLLRTNNFGTCRRVYLRPRPRGSPTAFGTLVAAVTVS